jgi:hypothetical protein
LLASAPYQLHDRRPDIQRQVVPACDKLCEARIGADIVQPLATTLDASISTMTGFCERPPTDDSKPSIPYGKMRRGRIREAFNDPISGGG